MSRTEDSAPGGPEELPSASSMPQLRPAPLQDLQRRLHADEDAEEQRGHFEDGVVVEVVGLADRAPLPNQRHRHQRRAARSRGGTSTGASSVPGTGLLGIEQRHGQHHADQQQRDVGPQAGELEPPDLRLVAGDVGRLSLAVADKCPRASTRPAACR